MRLTSAFSAKSDSAHGLRSTASPLERQKTEVFHLHNAKANSIFYIDLRNEIESNSKSEKKLEKLPASGDAA